MPSRKSDCRFASAGLPYSYFAAIQPTSHHCSKSMFFSIRSTLSANGLCTNYPSSWTIFSPATLPLALPSPSQSSPFSFSSTNMACQLYIADMQAMKAKPIRLQLPCCNLPTSTYWSSSCDIVQALHPVKQSYNKMLSSVDVI